MGNNMAIHQFYSDNGAPCWACSGTIMEYRCDDSVSIVDAICVSCHAREPFYPDAPHRDPAALSAAHRAAAAKG
jgi:hypothetical protein